MTNTPKNTGSGASRGNAFYFKTLKDRFSSNQFLFALSAFTLSVILSLAFLPNAMLIRIAESYDDLLYNIGMTGKDFFLSYSDLTNFIGIFGTAITVITILTMLAFVLFAVGLWIIFFSFLRKKPKAYIAGFKIIKAASVFALVCFIIIAAAIIVIMTLAFLHSKETTTFTVGDYSITVGSGAHSLFACLLALSLLFGTFGALYFGKVINSAGSLISCAGKWEKARISKYISLINIFTAILSLVPMAAYVYISANMDGGFMVPFFAKLLTITAAFSFNIFISKFNRAMNNAEHSIEKAKEKRLSREAEEKSQASSKKERKEKPVRCKKCGKYYDLSENEACPYCYFNGE